MKKIYTAISVVLYLFPVFSSAQTATFSYTGAMQEFVVPAFVTSVDVDARGAEGSPDGAGWGIPGKGGRVQASLNVTPGETLYVFVGGAGSSPAGGFNGGGEGGIANTGPTGGGGGGMSDIRQGGNSWSEIVIAAGGGGGCGGYNGVDGGNGGDLVGDTGTTGAATGGGGGTQISGGAGGAGAGGCGLAGTSGTQGTGGIGGNTTCGNGFGGGGGGGGGFYGGGGGGSAALLLCCPDWSGGGGGGSSYVNSSVATLLAHIQGFQAGNGMVTISYLLTEITEQENFTDIKLFPNPAENQLTIGSRQFAIKQIDIYSAYGKRILSRNVNSRQQTFDISGFDSGIYFVMVKTDRGMQTFKLVKE